MDDSALLSAALRYAERGWAVIPLHDVTSGVCSCWRAGTCKSPGKHPRIEVWQRSWSKDATSIRRSWSLWPAANIGLVTGHASGFWAMDVDPVHNGDVRLAELAGRYGHVFGLPSVITGSRGAHYYYDMPEGFTPTNSRGDLPVGLDVRGEGGFVVAPPSVSGIGPYVARRVLEAAVQSPPRWLPELIRPRVTALEEVTSSNDRLSNVDTSANPRLQAYALAAADEELRRLREAVPGSRGRTAFEVACSLIELVNAPWSGLRAQMVTEAYFRAADVAATLGGDFDRAEALSSWNSAQRRIGGKARSAPVLREAAAPETLDWPDGGGGAAPPFWQDAFGTPSGLSNAQPEVVAAPPDLADALLAQMLDEDSLATMPDPRPLIEGMLDLDSESWIIGPPGGLKSFVALDMAAHVAAGKPWQGHQVAQGTVVYMAAEGAKGIKRRLAAWRQVYGSTLGNLKILPMPVQARNGEAWGALVRACARLGAVFVVLDTQARITVGLEENSASDMGILVGAISALRRSTGACVLTVHHTGRNGGDARGSSAIDGAQDTEIRVERYKPKASLRAKISLDKQKDGADTAEVEIVMQVIDLDDGATSLAVTPADPFTVLRSPEPEWRRDLTTNQGHIVDALREHADEVGATPAQVSRWLKDRQIMMPQSSRDTAITRLVETGILERITLGRVALTERLR